MPTNPPLPAAAPEQVMDLQNVPTVHRTIDTHIAHYHVGVPTPHAPNTNK